MALRLAIGVVDRKPRARACAWDDEALDLREEEVGLVIDRPDRFVDLAPILRNDPALQEWLTAREILGAERSDAYRSIEESSKALSGPLRLNRSMTSSNDGPSSSGASVGSGFAASNRSRAFDDHAATSRQAKAVETTTNQSSALLAMRLKTFMRLTPMFG